MIDALADTPASDFERPPGLSTVDTCTPSGLRANDTCGRKGEEPLPDATAPKRATTGGARSRSISATASSQRS